MAAVPLLDTPLLNVFHSRGARYSYNIIATGIIGFDSIKSVDVTGKFAFRFQTSGIILLGINISFTVFDYDAFCVVNT